MGGDLAPNLGGTKKIFRGPISGKIPIFRVKISDDLFFSHRPGSSDFSHIFRMFTMLNVVYDHFLTRKTIFHSVHAFTHIRQHYFSKYLGGPMHGRSPHLKFWGDRPPSPPLGLRPCSPSSLRTHTCIRHLSIEIVIVIITSRFLKGPQ